MNKNNRSALKPVLVTVEHACNLRSAITQVQILYNQLFAPVRYLDSQNAQVDIIEKLTDAEQQEADVIQSHYESAKQNEEFLKNIENAVNNDFNDLNNSLKTGKENSDGSTTTT